MIAKPKRIHPQIEIMKDHLRVIGVDWVEEYRFHPTRLWRFDLAIPSLKIGIEYQGHGSTGKGGHIGRHASITGMTGDCEKYNEAQRLGWAVLNFTVLFFDENNRAKHKLTLPLDTIVSMIEERRIEP